MPERLTLQTLIDQTVPKSADSAEPCLNELAIYQNLEQLYEPPHEKTNNLHMRKKKDADQLRGNREADQRLCFRIVRFVFFLNPKFQASGLLL